MALQIRRGAAADLPQGEDGEPLFDDDNNRLYIGTGTGNPSKYIGSPRRTEWAQCTNTLTEDVATSSLVHLTWNTSGTSVSDSVYYTVAAAGITVNKTGTYAVEVCIQPTLKSGSSNSDNKPLELCITVDTVVDSYKATSLRYQSLLNMTSWKQVMDITAAEVIGVASKRATGTDGEVDLLAGESLLLITLLDE